MSPREIADAADALDILRWWISAGVDTLYADAPRDRFAEAASPRPAPPPRVAPAPAPAPVASRVPAATAPAPPGEAQRTAEELAARADSLEALAEAMRAFEGCALKRTATQLVFADGTPGAAVMIVGEAPGADEDRQGRPFVGPAGRMLDRMLAAIGLDRTGVYIANIVPWRPPGNRTPTPQETAICLPFIRRQIALSAPRVLVTMGNPSTQALLETKEGITRIRGGWRRYEIAPGSAIPALPTLHPAYLLRTPSAKRAAWLDLRALRARLDEMTI